jgi:DNA-binding CsgD family transcriptional regulator
MRGASRQRKGGDVIAVVEATYRIDGTDSEWLQGIAAAVAPLLDDGLGISALTTEARAGRVFIRDAACVGGSPELHEAVASYAGNARPSVLLDAFRFARCSSMSVAAGGRHCLSEDPASLAFACLGIRDALGILGIDGTRHTAAISVYLGDWSSPSPRFVARWNRVASHLAAGFRIRRGLATVDKAGIVPDPVSGSEAILTPGGQVKHSEGAAHHAHRSLARAVVGMERARGRLRVDDPDTALNAWRGLVSGRWSLVDHVDTDGQRFLLARENEPNVVAPTSVTPRERAVLSARARALSLKIIAYDLGLSIPAISASLASGMKKLGISCETELVALFAGSVSS